VFEEETGTGALKFVTTGRSGVAGDATGVGLGTASNGVVSASACFDSGADVSATSVRVFGAAPKILNDSLRGSVGVWLLATGMATASRGSMLIAWLFFCARATGACS
jgi:hypothetical protein